MNNIWYPYYKKLEKNEGFDLYSLEYDIKLERIKALIRDENSDRYYFYAEEVKYYSFTHNHGLYLAPFEHSKVIEQKEWPHHYFYEVKNSLLINELVENSIGTFNVEYLKHFAIRLSEGMFDVVTSDYNPRIVEIKY